MRSGPGPAFSPFLVPMAPKSDGERGQKVSDVTPHAPKIPPESPPNSMKNQLCGLRGVPGSPGGSRDTPRLEECSKKYIFAPSGAYPAKRYFYMFIFVWAEFDFVPCTLCEPPMFRVDTPQSLCSSASSSCSSAKFHLNPQFRAVQHFSVVSLLPGLLATSATRMFLTPLVMQLQPGVHEIFRIVGLRAVCPLS